MIEVISWGQAKDCGRKHYFTGKPCPKGHLSERFVSTKGCVSCLQEQRKKPGYNERYREWRRKRDRSVPIEERRSATLRKRYGMTIEDYNLLYEKQDGMCAICGVVQDGPFHVDHCHETGKIRGLLCKHCNQGIGHFRDDLGVLKSAIQYLERSKTWRIVN